MKNPSNTVERRKLILGILSEKGQVYVHELSSQFKVSEVTIRHDLDWLEKKNQLIRARGGAMAINNVVGLDKEISEKSNLNLKEKIRIGKLAATLVRDNDTIIIDSGTTTSEIIINLETIKDLTVITNALNNANRLINLSNVDLIIPGGFLRKTSLSLIGAVAEKSFKNFFADKLFLGVDGIDTTSGIYTPNMEEAHLNNLMIEISKQVIVVTDSSKFNRKSLAYICGMDQIDVIVTDDGIPEDDEKRILDVGIELLIAK